MVGIRIVRQGIMDTIQDNGRYGFAKWGINNNGSVDRYAAQVANALAGNDSGLAVLEMHFPAAEIVFDGPALISLTGADFAPHINGRPVPIWRSIAVEPNSTLSFLQHRSGSRCYLSVHGGFHVSSWLGSRSTNLKVAAGGFEGRSLRKEDRVPFGKPMLSIQERDVTVTHVFPWSANTASVYSPIDEIGLIEGKEWVLLTDLSTSRFFKKRFLVMSSSDRMSIALKHEPIQFRYIPNLLSTGVTFGTVQALPNGTLIVLMADHQTMGGYPCIGHVASAHLPRLAQLRPNNSFHFHRLSVEDAEKMVFSLHENMTMIRRACLEKLKRFYAEC